MKKCVVSKEPDCAMNPFKRMRVKDPSLDARDDSVRMNR